MEKELRLTKKDEFGDFFIIQLVQSVRGIFVALH